MRWIGRVVVALGLLCLPAVIGRAQVPLSSSGLGTGAHTAAVEGADSIVWNPAGLFYSTGMDWSLGNITVRDNTTLGYGAVLSNPPTSQQALLDMLRDLGDGQNQRVDASGSTMFSVGRLGFAILGDAAARFWKTAPGGDGEGVAETGSEFSFAVSHARQIGGGLIWGFNLRYVQAKGTVDRVEFVGGVPTLTASERARDADWALDLGAIYEPTESLRLGLMVRNLKKPSFRGINPDVLGPLVYNETSVTLGAALRTRKHVLLAVDWDNVTRANRLSSGLNLGLRTALGPDLDLRTGIYNGSWQLGVGLGMGLGLLNVAYSPSSDAMFSISMSF
jgi:hypothetical protein